MKKLYTLTLLLVLSFSANQVQAQFSLIPYAGYNTEDGLGFLVGIGAEFDAPFALGNLTLGIQPGIEYVSTDLDGFSYLQLDGNIIARFGAPGASIVPYAGAGLAVAFLSFDASDDFPGADSASDTELGLNLLGGAIFSGALSFGDPFVQARFSMIDNLDALSIMGGLRIPLGNN